MAYYYEGTGNAANLDTMSSIILGTSMLTARHIPVAGEYEVKNAIAMKIMDSFGAGGSFTEFYAVDYAEELVLMGHDGPGHVAIAEGKTKVRPLQVYHGKVGRGLRSKCLCGMDRSRCSPWWKTRRRDSSCWRRKANVSREIFLR